MYQENNQPIVQANSGIVAKKGWSWGGAVFSPYYVVGAGRHALLWWYLFAFVPFLNIIFWIVVFFYFGVNGYEVAARGTTFANQGEYDGYIKGMDHAGKIFFWIILAILLIACILWVVVFIPLIIRATHPALIGNPVGGSVSTTTYPY